MNLDQRNKIQGALIERGLTFTPLQQEMIDHIGCDVEMLMDSGKSFDDALTQTLNEIPADHFSAVQRDVLIGIDKRFAASKWLSNLTLAALLLSFFFKVLHLQFTNEIFIISCILIGATLLRGSFFGFSVTGKPKGSMRVLFTLSGLIMLLTGYAFKMLHLPGTETIIIVASMVNIAALLINTFAFFRYPPERETMLTFLHEKFTPGIERFLLILLFFITTVSVTGILMDFHIPVTAIILLIVIFGAGIHFITMIWRILQQQVLYKRPVYLFGIAIISVCLPLPFLGEILPWEFRVVAVTAFMVVSGLLAYSMQQQRTNVVTSILIGFVPLVFLLWAMLKLGILPVDFHGYLFNLPVLSVMIAGLLISKKHDTMRSFMIFSLAGYLIEYSRY